MKRLLEPLSIGLAIILSFALGFYVADRSATEQVQMERERVSELEGLLAPLATAQPESIFIVQNSLSLLEYLANAEPREPAEERYEELVEVQCYVLEYFTARIRAELAESDGEKENIRELKKLSREMIAEHRSNGRCITRS